MLLFTLLAFPMRVVGFLLEEMPRSVVSIARVDRILAALPVGPTRASGPAAGRPARGRGRRRSSSRTRAATGRARLHVPVEPGEVVALVGATGSGKSTLCDLVAGLDRPDRGVVTIGGIDARDIEPPELRAAVALVFQESFLFADSVGENITARFRRDRRRAPARRPRSRRPRGFIDVLPDGYDTVVGERGVTLSGGQRQRVALARALVRRPRLLILDDATSAVDPTVEARILGGLREELDMTTLIVAHRVSTIALADRVLYLHDGRIVATGHARGAARDPRLRGAGARPTSRRSRGDHRSTSRDTEPIAGPALDALADAAPAGVLDEVVAHPHAELEDCSTTTRRCRRSARSRCSAGASAVSPELRRGIRVELRLRDRRVGRQAHRADPHPAGPRPGHARPERVPARVRLLGRGARDRRHRVGARGSAGSPTSGSCTRPKTRCTGCASGCSSTSTG